MRFAGLAWTACALIGWSLLWRVALNLVWLLSATYAITHVLPLHAGVTLPTWVTDGLLILASVLACGLAGMGFAQAAFGPYRLRWVCSYEDQPLYPSASPQRDSPPGPFER